MPGIVVVNPLRIIPRFQIGVILGTFTLHLVPYNSFGDLWKRA